MRKRLYLAVSLLVLAVLACNAPLPGGSGSSPTDTPTVAGPPVRVPPAEVSPTELPAAARPTSTQSPTATPVPEEASPTVAPSLTPVIMCTLPACNEDEVYYCAGECPGGCGTQCATPTPLPPSAPAILSFTADRVEIVQGESVSLTWQASGGKEAHICWVTREAIMTCLPGPLDPDGGTEIFAPTAPGRPGNADITLTVRNGAGAAEAHVCLTIRCTEDPLPELVDQQMYGNCPYGTVIGNAAYQPFGNGYMIWLEGNRTIYVLYSDGRYETYADDFREGDPESDPSIVPPYDTLLQPIRGFGLVWRTHQNVRDGLGWALAPEVQFQGWSQSYSGIGMHNSGTFLRFIDGSVIHLSHFGGLWRFVGNGDW